MFTFISYLFHRFSICLGPGPGPNNLKRKYEIHMNKCESVKSMWNKYEINVTWAYPHNLHVYFTWFSHFWSHVFHIYFTCSWNCCFPVYASHMLITIDLCIDVWICVCVCVCVCIQPLICGLVCLHAKRLWPGNSLLLQCRLLRAWSSPAGALVLDFWVLRGSQDDAIDCSCSHFLQRVVRAIVSNTPMQLRSWT